MDWSGGGHAFGDTDNRANSFNSPGGFFDKTFGSGTPSSQDKRGDKKVSGVVPVTTAMIYSAEYEPETDAYVFDEIPIRQVTIVGVVSSLLENQTNLTFEIDDYNGPTLVVKRWIDQDNAEAYQNAVFREGTCVRVHGYIKQLDDSQKHVVAFAMHRVTSYNDVMYHMLDVIKSLRNLKKIKESENNPNPGNSFTQFGNNSFAAQGNQDGRAMESGMSSTNHKVLETISQATSPEGISIDELARRLKMTQQSVRDAVEYLSNEGHIYSTTDDDHFKSTNA